jgi:uncharacterized protein (TIGR03083 family)
VSLPFVRYCTEIVAQAELVRTAIAGADLATPVPSCPGWNVGQLIRHVGGAHREAETVVRTREQPGPDDFRDPTHFDEHDAAALVEWVVAGANHLATTLREAGPNVAVPGPLPDTTSTFAARRMTHETAMHRADAVLALGQQYELDNDVAVDAIDEWLELGSLPMHFDVHPWMRELLAPGRTLHLHATDTEAEWVVDLTGDAITWRRSHEKAPVAVRGPVVELLLLIYKRRPADSGRVEIIGDEELLDFWLERVSFG